MENNKNKLKEQDAPLKNTDGAFVKVSTDGSPAISQTADNSNNEQMQEEADLEQQRKEALTERD